MAGPVLGRERGAGAWRPRRRSSAPAPRCCAAAPSSRAARPTASRASARKACGCCATPPTQHDLKLVSEVMDVSQIELMDRYVDIFQVGARNMQNFTLLRELGRVRKPVLLKRGISATIEEWLLSAEYVLAGGNMDVDPVRARHPHLRELHPQHARHLGDSGRQEAESSAGLRRSQPRHRTPRQGRADGARRRRRRRRRPADRSALRSRPRAAATARSRCFPDQFERLMAELRIIAPAIGRSICLEPVARRGWASASRLLGRHGIRQRSGVFDRIGIVGLGLIGGSLALATRRAWPGVSIAAVDRDDVIADALATGVIDTGGRDIAALDEAALIVLAAPVDDNIRATGRARDGSIGSRHRDRRRQHQADHHGRGAPSAREHRVRWRPSVGRSGRSGLGAAAGDLFSGRPWIFTPDDTTSRPALERLTAFVSTLGAMPIEMDADAHDRLLATISHLPQLVVTALMNVVGRRAGVERPARWLAPGLIDTTRLASSPGSVWAEHLRERTRTRSAPSSTLPCGAAADATGRSPTTTSPIAPLAKRPPGALA